MSGHLGLTFRCVAALGLLSSCVNPVDDILAARADCPVPGDSALIPEARMLPGQICQECHRSAGAASRFAWTASGTVFSSKNADCESGGLEGVKVEILDPQGAVLITLMSNRAGNFYTSENRDFSHIRARVSKDGKVREMMGVQGLTACAVCHQPGGLAGGRIYLD